MRCQVASMLHEQGVLQRWAVEATLADHPDKPDTDKPDRSDTGHDKSDTGTEQPDRLDTGTDKPGTDTGTDKPDRPDTGTGKPGTDTGKPNRPVAAAPTTPLQAADVSLANETSPETGSETGAQGTPNMLEQSLRLQRERWGALLQSTLSSSTSQQGAQGTALDPDMF